MQEKQTWKRGFLEIIAEILSCLKEEPLKKTHITYRTNLDSRALTKYISILIYLEMIEQKPPLFRISAKGLKYLEYYDKLVDLMDKNLEKSVYFTDAKKVISNLKRSQ